METLRDIRQAYQDAGRGSRGGLSLPSLGDGSRRRSRLDPGPSPGLLSARTSCLPVPPQNRPRTRSVIAASPSSPALLSVAEPGQLSQSAPSIMEPLLGPNTVMQARAHIQTRLGSQDTVNEQKGSLLALHPRTPKLLAPLDRRPKDIAALPVLKHRVPLKPISRSPLCSRSRLRREKLSWGSPRTGLLTTKGGSEESGSSTHSSFDLEDEDEEDVCERAPGERHLKLVGERLARRSNDVTPTEAEMVGETLQRLKVLSRISPIPPIHSPAHDLEGEPINRTHSHCEGKATNDSLIKYHYAQQGNSGNDELSITSKSQEERNRVGRTREPGIHHGMTLHMNDDHGDAIASPEGACRNDMQHIKQTRRTMRDSCCEESQEDDPIPRREDVKIPAGTTQETRVQLFTPAGNLTRSDMDPNGDERQLKAFKPVLNKDRRTSMNCELRVDIPTTRQTFNGLAHTDRKSKSNLKLSTQDKSKNGPELKLSGETATKVKSKLKSVKGANCHGGANLPQKKPSDQGKRADPDKMTGAPPHAPPRELKSSRQSKRPGPAATPRSRSTVDFVAYKDVYREMQNGDDGSATYEIFAGPVYDSLRVSSSREKGKGRQVQSAPPRKTQQCHKVKHRPLKQAQRRCPAESVVVSAKSKPKLVSSRVKPHAAAVPRKGPHKVRKDGHTKAELVPSEDVGICQISDQETVLSTIEETLSRQGYETIKSNDKTLTPAASSLEDLRHPHMNMQEIRNPNRPVPELASPRSPRQPKINTWTSSCSSHAIMSPVYQKFLDEVGDGPLTDDLLQCLAEELISLDEREASTGPENLESNGEDDHASGGKTGLQTLDHEFQRNSTASAALLGSGLVVDDAITWTKGEVLGRGAYGTVYCILTSRGQLIAAKQVSLDSSDPDAAKKEYRHLQGEVELLKTLRHANIVGFLGTSLFRHVVSIFMEYIPGGSIASILHRFGPLPERVLALYTHQILEGVAYLHLNRVIHRDLKGNNVMLMPTGVIKLIDFGCARRLSFLNHTASSSSGGGDLLKSVHGTPYWMAPEVINETGYGRKSDIWSVGCTVFEMATGKPPLAHMDKMAALFFIGAQRGAMPSLPNGFSDHAKDFVKISLTCDQRLRPSADQLLKHPFIPPCA
ncbi:uncharacterized protein map3k19 isoform X2 [Pseudoliparis swirei]|nr:uncharacterized protein map3k19 isoform X2 [Pseudoliparis swirei]XP_056284971.1 uncharacterized protein map3k19 isoform X2 [Pseudoliparis swirei]XP_056284974.1 uncharacterized protein map3k19 isoform X2 [Pseudoliparis swirei]